jgi:DNA-binding XRE family transcriptional regulator
MNRHEFIDTTDKKIRLLRAEKDLSQNKMAEILGISKKTLVNIEKGRSSLGWACAVTACAIFRDSEILDATFGGDVSFLIQSLALEHFNKENSKTLGGKVWWKDINVKGDYKIQQNIISFYYRILDNEERRICSSFDMEFIEKRFEELVK